MNLERLASRAAALCGDRRVRTGFAAIGFAAITLVTILIAHPSVFNGFANFDDEGYMLVSLKSFLNQGHLYDQVFTQYGPFYYEAFGGVFSLFGIAVTNDAGRTMTMVIWVAASLLLGLGILRITRSVLLGFGTQILCFNVLTVLAGAQMHPVGIIALMLGVILVIAGFVGERESPYAMGLLGMAAAALFLIKVNVGGFAIISIALACLVSFPVLWCRRWLRIGFQIFFLAVPLLLMLNNFGEGWVRHYAVNVTVSVLAVLLALEVWPRGERKVSDLRWLLGGFALLAVISCGAIIAAGTSLHGLYEGLIGQPLRQPNSYINPVQFAHRLYAFDVIGLAAAAAYWFALRRRAGEAGQVWYAVWSVFAILVGLTMAFSVTGRVLPFDSGGLTGYQFSMEPFIWVSLISTVPGERPDRSFARVLLPVLAVLQTLHAFPVSGSQMWLANLLLVPVGALCVSNGVRGLSRAVEVGADRLALAGFGVAVVVVLAWFSVDTFLREPLHVSRANYNAGVSLGLPGSQDVHVSAPEAAQYRQLTAEIEENCNSLVMLPGIPSFYLWTGQEPPSYTAGGWETLFDAAHQEKVIEDTAPIEGLCLLRNYGIQALWGTRNGPLVEYLEGPEFKKIGGVSGYELLRRDGPAGSSA